MSSVLNLLGDQSSKFSTDVGGWISASNELSATRTKKRQESDSSSLRIYDTNGSGASAKIDINDIPQEYHNWPLRGFAWINCDVSGEVTITLTSIDGGVSTAVSATESIISDTWTLLSVELESVSASSTQLELHVSTQATNSGDSLYISRPAIMSPWAAAQSVFGGEVWLRLPEYLQVTDKNQTNPDVPLFRFIEVLFNLANSIDATWTDFRWIPPEDNDRTIKESGLVSPNIALPPALVWMAQVIGSTLLDPTAAYTPWLYLDNDTNPQTAISWADWLDALDENNDNIVTWDEIQNYNPQIFDLTGSFRTQVNKAFYGYKAGTYESLIAAAKTVSGVNTVTVFPHEGGDPFNIGIEILASEGGSTVDVERALVDTTPAGYQITVSSV